MSEKLTCKMSDGTEWEVTFYPADPGWPEDGSYVWARCAYLMPIVRVDVGSNQWHKVRYGVTYAAKTEEREPKKEIDLTKLTEVKTYEGLIGSHVDEAIRTLAKMAAMHKCLARMEVNGITLTAAPWMSEEGNIQHCKDLLEKKLKEPKREPREWWTILFSPDDNPVQLQANVRFETKEKAEQWANQYYKFNQYEVVQVREVIK